MRCYWLKQKPRHVLKMNAVLVTKAAEFIRESLVLRDGKIYSKKLDSPVSEFLESHRGLKTDDVEFFMTLFTRVAHEVYRP